MARITVEIDDALLGQAAHALGTRSAEDTVRAALTAAAAGGIDPPLLPRRDPPDPGRPGVVPPVVPPLDPPARPAEFPHPPEIR